jgi:alpha-methylacyl-CoA racemase
MEGTDVCFAPVLSMTEAPGHPHNVARGTFIEVEGVAQPAPAPRFSRTAPATPAAAAPAGSDTAAVLAAIGYADDRIKSLRDAGVLT